MKTRENNVKKSKQKDFIIEERISELEKSNFNTIITINKYKRKVYIQQNTINCSIVVIIIINNIKSSAVQIKFS